MAGYVRRVNPVALYFPASSSLLTKNLEIEIEIRIFEFLNCQTKSAVSLLLVTSMQDTMKSLIPQVALSLNFSHSKSRTSE